MKNKGNLSFHLPISTYHRPVYCTIKQVSLYSYRGTVALDHIIIITEY
jgi:hypothetical protein